MKLKVLLAILLIPVAFAVPSLVAALNPVEEIPAPQEIVLPVHVDSSKLEAKKEDPKTIKIKRIDLTKANVTYLTTEVNAMSVDVVINDINGFNAKNNKPIYLLLDTPGGSVIDGGRLISTIQASKNPVYAVCMQLCASMGFMILEHSHQRMGVSRAILMGHPASIGMILQAELDKAVSRLSFLKRYVDKMDAFIANRAGIPVDKFKAMTSQELWIDSEDALEMKLLDSVVAVILPSMSEINLGNNKLKEALKME